MSSRPSEPPGILFYSRARIYEFRFTKFRRLQPTNGKSFVVVGSSSS